MSSEAIDWTPGDRDRRHIDAMAVRLERLEQRMNWLFGALGVIVVLANGGLAVVVGALVAQGGS